MEKSFSFQITQAIDDPRLGRAGVVSTAHGDIKTPAFIPVGTKATVKAMTPEMVSDAGGQAVLANAYHLYLQPGHKIIEQLGGIHRFMSWDGPTFTDSGGFQVLSLGSGYKKVISMDAEHSSNTARSSRHAFVDEDGVNFKSHLDGSMHRFTPELSMQIQFSIGADICFAFDELTSLADPYSYQIEALNRTHNWAQRSVDEFRRLQKKNKQRKYQALFGVLQGANYEDLRRSTAQHLASLDFDGFGIGGAIEKDKLGEIIGWCNEELPADKPKHLLGISEPNDMFEAVAKGIDTFDCVSPTRVARNGAFYTFEGRVNVTNARYRKDERPLLEDCNCYTCMHYSRAYLHHLHKSRERLGATLTSIHNEHFIIKLVADMRQAILDNSFDDFRSGWLKRYYAT